MTEVVVDGGTGDGASAAELEAATRAAEEAGRADADRHGEHVRRMDAIEQRLMEVQTVANEARGTAADAVGAIQRVGEEVTNMRAAVSLAAEAAAAAVEVAADVADAAAEPEQTGEETPEPAQEAPRRKREWA